MPSPSPAADPKPSPSATPDPTIPSVAGEPLPFSLLEWNALTNRAKALLQVMDGCRQAGYDAPACGYCPVGGGYTPTAGTDPEVACRVRFRATQQQLFRLAHRVGGPERHQLQRTVASLHLAYRNIDRGGDGR